jgi:hypothetical protein
MSEKPTKVVPELTKKNWSTEFAPAMLNKALKYGKAGRIILTGRDIPVAMPVYARPKYEASVAGYAAYQRDKLEEEKYEDQRYEFFW